MSTSALAACQKCSEPTGCRFGSSVICLRCYIEDLHGKHPEARQFARVLRVPVKSNAEVDVHVAEEVHCATCMCARRAPVQGERDRAGGSITWAEHLEVYERYAAKYGCGQSAERLAERGGFGYKEAERLLGRPLRTWRVREK